MSAHGLIPRALLAAVAAAVTALPAANHNEAVLTWTFLILLYASLAQSWNLLGGFGGQVNLGTAGFFGLGALVTRFLWLGGHPLWEALTAGGLASVVMSAVVGIPSLRFRGPYFAIGTLAVAEILWISVGNALPDVSPLPPALLATYSIIPRYYLALGLATAVTLVAWWLTRSRFGCGLAAVREDEGVAEAIGVDPFRHKLVAFMLSGIFAGIAGGIFGYYHVSFYPNFVFDPVWTFDPLLIAYLGGIGTVWGPVIGAVFFLVLQETLALKAGEMHLLVFGVLFIVVVLALPGGLMDALGRLSRRFLARHPSPVGAGASD
jgi:branched-chain amino acid transport system permease protein